MKRRNWNVGNRAALFGAHKVARRGSLFYVVRHGTHRTAMFSWGKALTDGQIWKVVAL